MEIVLVRLCAALLGLSLAAPPTARGASHIFMCAFDRGSAEMSSACQTETLKAVEAWKRALPHTPGTRVGIVGHADILERPADRISAQRGEAIAAFLRLNGVPSAQIRVVAEGSRRPLRIRQVPDREEPENRRAEMLLIGPAVARPLRGFLDSTLGRPASPPATQTSPFIIWDP